MVTHALTTPVREHREHPLAEIDDNKRSATKDNNQFLKPTTLPAPQPTRLPKLGTKNEGAEKKRSRKAKPSSLCLTPPSLIQGGVGQSYHRGLCIGEGGFARCFQVKNGNGEVFAAKTIAKEALKNQKTRDKLITEIDIHRSMNHPNIVRFIDCFEDDVNVYMLLEMCNNRSLADLVYRRRQLTEPEARYYFMQILGAIGHMHTRGVVHRDLKLGNIFIDKHMSLKVGDFGLAAILENRSSRRYTICGTPNYISPEVLRRPHAHDTATDIWALGIILYAMLVGRPPFQDRDVSKIYERIRNHSGDFPPAPSTVYEESWARVSPDARDLITKMLDPDPLKRPVFSECLDSPWVLGGVCVSSVPLKSLNESVYLFATTEESKQNYKQLLLETKLDVLRTTENQFRHRSNYKDLATSSVSRASGGASAASGNGATLVAQATGGKILPHHISPPSTKDKYTQVVVADDGKQTRQNVPDYDSPVVGRGLKVRSNLQEMHNSPGFGRLDSTKSKPSTGSAATFARYSKYAAPAAGRTSTHKPLTQEKEGMGQYLDIKTFRKSINPEGTDMLRPTRAIATTGLANIKPITSSSTVLSKYQAHGTNSEKPVFYKNMLGPLRASLRHTISNILMALQTTSDGSHDAPVEQVTPPLVLTRWADFEENWGMAYCYNDGSVGTLFRDETNMRMDPVFNTFAYYEWKSRPGYVGIHSLIEGRADPKQAKKISVLNYVKQYMDRELAHAIDPTRKGGDVAVGEILHSMFKGSDFIMFVTSNGTVQFNFKDHNKVVVYDDGKKVGLITGGAHSILSWNVNDALKLSQGPKYQSVNLASKLQVIADTLASYSRVV